MTLAALISRFGMTLGAVLRWEAFFAGNGSQVNRQALEILLLNSLGLDRIKLFTERGLRLEYDQLQKLYQSVKRLESGEPLDYIIGHTSFLGRKYRVDPRVLVPRPETEELVMLVEKYISKSGSAKPMRLLDCGTGSGCIAISLALGCSSLDVFAWDVSEGALEVAQSNAEALKANVHFTQKDLLRNDSWLTEDNFHILVSNPPYISSDELSSFPCLDWEPRLALVGEGDGLVFYRQFAKYGKSVLHLGGVMFLEIGHTQGKQVCDIFAEEEWSDITLAQDCSGKNRFVIVANH